MKLVYVYLVNSKKVAVNLDEDLLKNFEIWVTNKDNNLQGTFEINTPAVKIVIRRDAITHYEVYEP